MQHTHPRLHNHKHEKHAKIEVFNADIPSPSWQDSLCTDQKLAEQ